MSIIQRKINGVEFVFYCEFKNTRSGFAHHVRMYADGREVSSARISYLNRTWERYEYQSAIKSAICAERESVEAKLKRAFMRERGYKNLTAARKKEFDEVVNANAYVQTLQALRDSIEASEYGTEEEKERLAFLDKMLGVVTTMKELGVI